MFSSIMIVFVLATSLVTAMPRPQVDDTPSLIFSRDMPRHRQALQLFNRIPEWCNEYFCPEVVVATSLLLVKLPLNVNSRHSVCHRYPRTPQLP